MKRIRLDQNILHTWRGDSFQLPLYINEGTVLEPHYYELNSYDKLHVGLIEPHALFESAVIKKEYTRADVKYDAENNPYILFYLPPAKYTEGGTLDLVPSTYYLEAKLEYHSDATTITGVETVLPRTKFILLE